MTVSFESITEDLRSLVGAMKSVKSFRINDDLKQGVERVAAHIETGQTDKAMDAALEVMKAGRAILGAFIRNAVMNRTPEGQPEQIAPFTLEVERLKKNTFDTDIVERVETARKRLEEVVRVESNGTFEQRIPAYNAMRAALESAHAEQNKRDQVRLVQIKAGTRKVTAGENGQNPRIEMIAARVEQAKSLRSLI